MKLSPWGAVRGKPEGLRTEQAAGGAEVERAALCLAARCSVTAGENLTVYPLPLTPLPARPRPCPRESKLSGLGPGLCHPVLEKVLPVDGLCGEVQTGSEDPVQSPPAARAWLSLDCVRAEAEVWLEGRAAVPVRLSQRLRGVCPQPPTGPGEDWWVRVWQSDVKVGREPAAAAQWPAEPLFQGLPGTLLSRPVWSCPPRE